MIRGISAGLHCTVELPETDDEEAIADEARRRHIDLAMMSDYRVDSRGPPTLLLGYAQILEAAIPAGIRELAEAVRASRSSRS
jgi:GntR family transcriptional regulator / MocR family aminotransferase